MLLLRALHHRGSGRRLQSGIVNYQNVGLARPAFNTNCTSGCTVMSCSCTSIGGYWASSSVAIAPQDAWFVRFNIGFVEGADKSQIIPVRRPVIRP